MNTKVISNEYITYGGDFERTLYLQDKISGRGINLCLTGDDYTVCHHLTSTEPEYIKWLFENSHLLLSLNNKEWYKSELGRPEYDLCNTFHYTLRELHKLIK